MNKKRIITGRFITILLLTALTLLSCKEGSSGSGLKWDESPEKYVYTDESTPYGVLIVDNAEKEYDIFAEVQSDAKDLYVGVYNSGTTSITNPEIEVSEFDSRKFLPDQTEISSRIERIQDNNSRLANRVINTEKSWNRTQTIENPYSSEVEGTKITFKDGELVDSNRDGYIDSIKRYDYESTLQKITTVGDKTLKIWVEDTCWHINGNENYLITPEMIDFIGENFLTEGTFNDIYDWVTNIYGEEWGVHNYTDDLIGDYDEINIVFADIMNDDMEDGVVGYFWAKDNCKITSETDETVSETDISNQRIVFYIEANYLAYTEAGDTWSNQGYYAKDTLSTLAHEFQHMINFYQASVIRGNEPETWLNELLSMATEDLLSDPDKLNTDGPKGFTGIDGKSLNTGSNITTGRIPLYIYWPDFPFNFWASGDYALFSYSLMYVYGAYLMRNFGGPEVLQNLQHEATGATDLPAALSFGNNSVAKAEITIPLLNAAVLLSQRTDVEEYMRFNIDGWFKYTLNGHPYKLNSLNFFAYSYTDSTGSVYTEPYVYTTAQEKEISNIPAGIFYFTEYVTDMTGRYHIGLSSDYPDADVVEVLLK